MDERDLRKALSDLPLGDLRYYKQTGSTNDVALAWATEGAPDLSLVYAEEQTAGRGRGGRRWFTPPETALAFSLVFKPAVGEEQSIGLFSALGALAVSEALAGRGLSPEIKWPNDVLLNRHKVCGVLAESVWTGEKVDSIVLGIGVNITAGAVPAPEQFDFPATYLEVEAELAQQGFSGPERILDRPTLLHEILQAVLHWRTLLTTDEFRRLLESRLAFRGEQVEILAMDRVVASGQVDGLEEDGSLRLRSPQGEAIPVAYGEIHLRPVV